GRPFSSCSDYWTLQSTLRRRSPRRYRAAAIPISEVGNEKTLGSRPCNTNLARGRVPDQQRQAGPEPVLVGCGVLALFADCHGRAAADGSVGLCGKFKAAAG